MERPFWVSGAVPPARLPDVALQRPAAMQALRQALAAGGGAWIGGQPGSGRTTLLHQAAAAIDRPLVVVDVPALARGDEAEALRAVRTLAPRKAAVPEGSTWADAVAAWHPNAGLAFDGAGPDQEPWLRALAGRLGVPFLAVGTAGVSLDHIPDAAAHAFLEGRLRWLRMTWTPTAMRETIALAAGHPGILQRVAAGALHAALDQGRRRITLDDYLEGAVEAAQASGGRDPLRGLPGPRQALLKAISRAPNAAPTEWAKRCGLDPKAAVVHLRRLELDDGLLQRTGRGRYRIAWPLLALHIQGRYGTTPVRLVVPAGRPARAP